MTTKHNEPDKTYTVNGNTYERFEDVPVEFQSYFDRPGKTNTADHKHIKKGKAIGLINQFIRLFS